jgi:RNA polymerase-binding transcription factor DksA
MSDQQAYTFPVQFDDVHYIASLYTADKKKVNNLLEGTGLKAGLHFFGKPVVALGLIQYKVSDLGAYNEIILAIPVIRNNEKTGLKNWFSSTAKADVTVNVTAALGQDQVDPKTLLNLSIEYATGASEVPENIKPKLLQIAQILKDDPRGIAINGHTDNTGAATKLMEDVDTSEREQMSQSAARLQKFITQLENALIRIKNGTYGVCIDTGKLIPKERLRAVPHTQQTIEAKLRRV